ncbi:hypothetical protein [Streptomyces sp. H27-C3]|uniref:hypothetical protein n=1 Tax=Streptomyces sp. H27-C3 TaxID=3046305 RepID=UPI0024BB7464|nr:hypothetical protein [Streptomyces sp. H27-C3]MDJ0466453.1 hypothetical protein [Streptomyces sp. H27-C3]
MRRALTVRLGGPVRALRILFATARDSFAEGLALIALGAVPVLLALAVTAKILLRNVGRTDTDPDTEKQNEAVPTAGRIEV